MKKRGPAEVMFCEKYRNFTLFPSLEILWKTSFRIGSGNFFYFCFCYYFCLIICLFALLLFLFCELFKNSFMLVAMSFRSKTSSRFCLSLFLFLLLFLFDNLFICFTTFLFFEIFCVFVIIT